MSLAPRDVASVGGPIEVFPGRLSAVVASGGHWLHEAVYWLRHEANTDLNLTFPADAEVLSVSIDGAETAPLQAEPRRLWMPLTGRPAVCRVRIQWRYATEDWIGRISTHEFAGSAREQCGVDRVAPPGWEPVVSPEGSLRSGLVQAAALSWRRAEAQFRMSDLLAARSSNDSARRLAETQRRFYVECRWAKLTLETAPAEANSAWPVGRTPLDCLQELLQKNKELAEARRFEAIRPRRNGKR